LIKTGRLNYHETTDAGIILYDDVLFLHASAGCDSADSQLQLVHSEFNAKSLEKIENLIIIEGIKQDSPPSEDDVSFDDAAGMIVYDDSFSIHSPDHQNEVKGKKNDLKEGDRSANWDEEFRALRRRDSRWHMSAYTIRKRDNLWSIARRFATHHHLIIKANRIDRPSMLREGATIKVPTRNGVYHQVRRGDTLSGLSKKFGIDARDIASHNGIKGDSISVQQRLFLPGARNIETAKSLHNEKSTSLPNRTATGKIHATARTATNTPQQKIVADRHFFSWPVRGSITSSFGSRTNPLTMEKSFHSGIDIGLPIGTAISASEKGRVIFSGWKDSYGNMVVLKHENGYITVYAHNKKNLVSEDDEVKKGDTIALSGMTGSVTGPHLHFEIRKNLTPLNPRRFLR
jgi:murein DD-endopeptidase MepM/ murein hydrolase activator NlpD